jgi:hypothetical protein
VTGVTIGGVTIGLMILGHVLVAWFPGTKRLQKKPVEYLGLLVPFVLAVAYGTLGVLCAMGLIGWAFDTALWASNWLGDAALWLGVGEEPGQLAAGRYVPLTVFGNCFVLVATVCMVTAIKKGGVGRDLKLGTWCGLCLGTSSGVAGLAAVPLAEAVNWTGNILYGAFA